MSTPNHTYDFSTQLHHLRRGRPFSGATLGFGAELFDSEADWKAPLRLGTVLELVLLYSRQQEQSLKQKRECFATALKVRDCGTVELTPANVEAIREAIGVLTTEPFGLINAFLDAPIDPAE